MYNEEKIIHAVDDGFRKKFKYYKSNKPKPSLSAVISIEDGASDKMMAITNITVNEDLRTSLLGLHSIFEWKTYTFPDHPGLLIIRNPFTTLGQRYWMRQCLEVYPRKPNKINIDIEMNLQDWWAECSITGRCNRTLQRKLRWTTLGYHHNWDTKVYTEENKSSFPSDLAELSDVVACYLGYSSFKAEAAIVNYYHLDSTLSAHTDHSEVNLEAPLLSFSFGQSAIFLLGGKDKFIEPSAILLQSGDIVVMSKEARLCYHAVPKILPATKSPWNNLDCEQKSNFCYPSKLKYSSNQKEIVAKMNKSLDNATWSNFDSYIEESRINVNVRQVLNENQACLTDLYFNDT